MDINENLNSPLSLSEHARYVGLKLLMNGRSGVIGKIAEVSTAQINEYYALRKRRNRHGVANAEGQPVSFNIVGM